MKGVSGLKAGHSKVIYFITDALSTVRDVVNSSGAVLASYEFDEYGRRISPANTGGVESQKTFVGGMSVQDEVADTGLMMMGHRFYAPDLGRFLNRDPIGFDGGANLFEYGKSSPTLFIDPLGLQELSQQSTIQVSNDPFLMFISFGLGVLRGMGQLAVGASMGFILALLAPEGLIAAATLIGLGLFVFSLMDNFGAICSSETSPYVRSELLGESLVALASFGWSARPRMRKVDDPAGYFSQGWRGRLAHEWKQGTISDADWKSGKGISLETWRPWKAWGKGQMESGPTPGGQAAAYLATATSLGFPSISWDTKGEDTSNYEAIPYAVAFPPVIDPSFTDTGEQSTFKVR